MEGICDGGGGQPEVKIFRQLKKTVELMLSEMFGPEADIIINVSLSFQVTAQTVTFTPARRPGILNARLWRGLSPKNPGDSPDKPLGT